MGIKLSNNASSRLAANLSISDTTIVLAAGGGAVFPALAAGDWFPATLVKMTGEFEIVKVTARSTDTLTVQRGQENTAASIFQAGDRIELRLTAGALQALLAEKIDKAGNGSITGNLGVSGALSAGSMSAPSASFSTLNGGTPWTTANFNPVNYMPVAGGTFSGMLYTASLNSVMAQNDGTSSFEVRNASGTGDAGMALMSFHCQGTYAAKLGLRSDGYFGFGGWSSAAWRFYAASNGDFISAGNVGAYSDPRLKEDVSVIDGALEIIEQLRGVRFTWNGRTKLIGKPGERDIGVMADEVEAVLPEIVGRSIPDDENGGEQWRVVAYDKLVPVLIEAVKELAGEVRSMKRGA